MRTILLCTLCGKRFVPSARDRAKRRRYCGQSCSAKAHRSSTAVSNRAIRAASLKGPGLRLTHLCALRTHEDVARELGLTRSRIQQIESEAFAKLRRDPILRELMGLWPEEG